MMNQGIVEAISAAETKEEITSLLEQLASYERVSAKTIRRAHRKAAARQKELAKK